LADSAPSATPTGQQPACRRNLYAAGLLLVVVFITAGAWGQQPASLKVAVKQPFEFVAYGDIRFTNPADKAPSNAEYRRALVKQIAFIKPSFVLLTGDLVLRGDNPADWAIYASESRAWAEAKLPLFPTIGNHELYKDEAVGLRNYFQHFPELKESHYYSMRAGSALTLVLDSSQDETTGAQGEWLASQLDHLPSDVAFVFIVLHHPPYTRSKEGFMGVAGHTARAREQALAKMLEARQLKTRPHFIVFSGHVHNYERYEHHGVTYIVTGGGGATPYVVVREPGDGYQQPGPTYHYCLVRVNGTKLQLDMMKLEMQNGQLHFTRADSVVIISAPAPPAKAASAK
jgi:predicted MPP superfamily phosphohydrolase